MKPIVGVTPLWDAEKQSLWMLPGYLNGIRAAGGLPLLLPLACDSEDALRLCSLCDGILFTGGQDVSPSLYGEAPLTNDMEYCAARDDLEQTILKHVLETQKPALGICRGIQFFNAALGGTLYQDLPSQRPGATEHHQSPPYDVPVHTVEVVAQTPLESCLSGECLAVNSYHHQGIKTLAPPLEVMAYAEDGLPEAVYLPGHPFFWAVQWHPEFSYETDANSLSIFQAFIAAMD